MGQGTGFAIVAGTMVTVVGRVGGVVLSLPMMMAEPGPDRPWEGMARWVAGEGFAALRRMRATGEQLVFDEAEAAAEENILAFPGPRSGGDGA
jgi:hypothetical protein